MIPRFTFFVAGLALQTGICSGMPATTIEQDSHHWVSVWASMPQMAEPANLPPAPFVC